MRNLIGFVVILCMAATVSAQETTDDPKNSVTVETVVEGLTNPCGVAVQPGTGHVFVADSGALRVVRIVEDKIEPVITGFPQKDEEGSETRNDLGPLGLSFIDQNSLVVGEGGQPAGEDMLRVFKVPAAGADPITADEMEGDAQRLVAEPDADLVGEGNFYGVSVIGTSVFVTCYGDKAKGWLGKADVVDGKLTNFNRSIATAEKTGVAGPFAVTRSPEGYIVVSQTGEIGDATDSLLTFYDESEEELADWKYETGLKDITGLAYGPKRGRLFAIDFSRNSTSKGSLYKLVADTTTTCKAVKLTDLDGPTAMAFDPQGNLYVTVMGTKTEGQDGPNGKLLVIKGLDDKPSKEK